MADEDTPVSDAPAVAARTITLDVFARTLRPRTGTVPSTSKPGAMRQTLLPGDPDEVYLKLLKIRHRGDKRTQEGWKALIDTYRSQPAHPTVLGR
jgi:hypothetical protein